MRWISITALVSASLFPAAIASPCRPHSTTTFGVSSTAISLENQSTTTTENSAPFTTTTAADATTTAVESGTITKARTTSDPEAETPSTAGTLTTTTNAETTTDLPEISISTQATSSITTDTTISLVSSSSSADTTTSSTTTSPSVPTFLANTGFDDQPGTTQPWSLSSPNIGSLSLDSNIVHDGINSARIDFLTYAGSKYVEQAYGSAIEAGHTYSVSVWTKGGSGCSQTYAVCHHSGGNAGQATGGVRVGLWAQLLFSCTYTQAQIDQGGLTIRVGGICAAGSKVWIDTVVFNY